MMWSTTVSKPLDAPFAINHTLVLRNSRCLHVYGNPDEPEGNVVQSFEWDIDLENNPGGYYSLRLVQGTQTVDSGPINIIDDLGRSATDPPPTSTAPTSGVASADVTTSGPASASATSGATSVPTAATSDTAAATAGPTESAGTSTAAAAGTTGGSNPAEGGGGGGGGGLSGGAIAGIVIGVLVVVALVGFLVWFLRRRAQKRRTRERSTAAQSGFNDEKGHADGRGTFLTAAPFAAAGVGAAAAAAAAGATHGKGGIEQESKSSELDGVDKPLQSRPGVHELHAPDTGWPVSHELHSPDASTLATNGKRDTTSDASRTEVGDSSVSELIGSPVAAAGSGGDGGGGGGAPGQTPISPEETPQRGITRKEVGSTGADSGTRPPVHELS